MTYAAVGEALSLDAAQWPPLKHPLDVMPTLQALQSERVVPVQDLASTAEAIAALSDTAQWAENADAGSKLVDLAVRTAPPQRLAARLCTAFERDDDGVARLSSAAFPALRQRRVALSAAEAALSRAVKDLVASGALSDVVSEAGATPQWREGRLVIPVRPGDKRKAGVEVGASRSGRTCFVEPHALVPPSAAVRASHQALAACEARLVGALCALLEANDEDFILSLLFIVCMLCSRPFSSTCESYAAGPGVSSTWPVYPADGTLVFMLLSRSVRFSVPPKLALPTLADVWNVCFA